ncbi:30S ribosomal protein S2 [Candidatus Fermentibacterales bacterium]|nr:30S ribosomal protein S2 [Candidatus Fermentibacterales bacterium]
MQIPSHEQLLEAGVHFGHQVRRWNPRMKPFIFMARNGIHIIDLKKTRACLEDAANLVARVAADGKGVLFVSTKKQGRECVREQAQKCGQFFVTERWLGGTLTNHKTVYMSVHRLEELQKMEEEGFAAGLTKKERLSKVRERERLEKYMGGIRGMKEIPGAVVVVDIKKENIAVLEARKLGIPCIAIVDTNCDPTSVDYPVPGNDDAIKSISLIVSTLAEAVLLGREGVDSGPGPEDQEAPEQEQEPARKEEAGETASPRAGETKGKEPAPKPEKKARPKASTARKTRKPEEKEES